MNAQEQRPFGQLMDWTRVGYSPDLYETIAEFGVQRDARVANISTSPNAAADPFAASGLAVEQFTVDAGAARREAERFGIVLAANVMQWVERSTLMECVLTLLQPGGTAAVWFSQEASDDGVAMIRRELFGDLGLVAPATVPGFRDFYASSLQTPTLRVLPWQVMQPLSRVVRREALHDGMRAALGDRFDRYIEGFEERLRVRFGDGDPSVVVAYVQFLYLGKKD